MKLKDLNAFKLNFRDLNAKGHTLQLRSNRPDDPHEIALINKVLVIQILNYIKFEVYQMTDCL